MHRIDSATARENANGDGKTGFHDNADLPNQDATYFTPEWANALQEEVAGVIEGLSLTLDKSDNGQLLAALVQQFGEKKVLEQAITEYKEMIEADRTRLAALEARTYEDTQIGEHIWTSQHFLTPEAVTAYKGYGGWERALQGRVAVGFSDNPDDIIEFRTLGAEFGENEHTLTVEESASHNHNDGTFDRLLTASGVNTASGSDPTPGHVSVHGEGGKIQPVGGDQPHNNIQQSKTLDCWKRIA